MFEEHNTVFEATVYASNVSDTYVETSYLVNHSYKGTLPFDTVTIMVSIEKINELARKELEGTGLEDRFVVGKSKTGSTFIFFSEKTDTDRIAFNDHDVIRINHHGN